MVFKWPIMAAIPHLIIMKGSSCRGKGMLVRELLGTPERQLNCSPVCGKVRANPLRVHQSLLGVLRSLQNVQQTLLASATKISWQTASKLQQSSYGVRSYTAKKVPHRYNAMKLDKKSLDNVTSKHITISITEECEWGKITAEVFSWVASSCTNETNNFFSKLCNTSNVSNVVSII